MGKETEGVEPESRVELRQIGKYDAGDVETYEVLHIQNTLNFIHGPWSLKYDL